MPPNHAAAPRPAFAGNEHLMARSLKMQLIRKSSKPGHLPRNNFLCLPFDRRVAPCHDSSGEHVLFPRPRRASLLRHHCRAQAKPKELCWKHRHLCQPVAEFRLKSHPQRWPEATCAVPCVLRGGRATTAQGCDNRATFCLGFGARCEIVALSIHLALSLDKRALIDSSFRSS